MPSSTELTSILMATPNKICPECGCPRVIYGSRPTGVVDNSGASLWTLTEECTMCSWRSAISNVKMGA